MEWNRVGGPLCGIAAQDYFLTLDCAVIGSSGTINDVSCKFLFILLFFFFSIEFTLFILNFFK